MSCLRSGLVGHALHPLLTDLPLGFWTSATVLDLRGRHEDRGARQWLVGAGLLASAPAALTGLADGPASGRRSSGSGAARRPERRGETLYVTSYVARSRKRHALGVAAALLGAAVTSASGYLGGHLTTARKVGSRDPAFDRHRDPR